MGVDITQFRNVGESLIVIVGLVGSMLIGFWLWKPVWKTHIMVPLEPNASAASQLLSAGSVVAGLIGPLAVVGVYLLGVVLLVEQREE